MRRLASAAAACAVVMIGAPVRAKQVGFHSPGGREIYDAHDEFAEAVDHGARWLVAEVATGAGPEGNLGLLVGAINVGVHGLEVYAGAGLEVNPARHYTGAVRFFPEMGSFRPYASLGYLLNDSYALGVHSHNAFAEIGHKWPLHDTYHVTLGIGLRRVLAIEVRETSVLAEPDVDRALLDRQIDDVMPRWLPTIALRFSRAF